jgi:hypothetical protein
MNQLSKNIQPIQTNVCPSPWFVLYIQIHRWSRLGMFVARRGTANIFATVLPKRVASIHPIQSVALTYTTMGFQPIHHPSDKVILTEETKHLLHSYIHSPSYKDPAPSGRISPTVTISADSLLS